MFPWEQLVVWRPGAAAITRQFQDCKPVLLRSRRSASSQVTFSVVMSNTPSPLFADQTAPYGCFFTRGLHHPDRPGRGQVIVGYANFYDSETDPFPCWEKIERPAGQRRTPGPC